MERRLMPKNTAMKTLADLRARCEVHTVTDCWRWLGQKRHGSDAPEIWIAGRGEVSLQVALPILATGKPAPDGVRYIPKCGNLGCMNWAHRRPGTRGELMKLQAAVYKNARAAAQQKRQVTIRSNGGHQPAEGSARSLMLSLAADSDGVYASKLARAADCAPDHANKILFEARKAGLLIGVVNKSMTGPDKMRVHCFLTREAADAWLAVPVVPRRAALAPKTGRVRVEPRRAPVVAPKPAPSVPVDMSRATVTQCPSGTDFRFTVTGPVPRVVDSSQCSPWARAAAGD